MKNTIARVVLILFISVGCLSFAQAGKVDDDIKTYDTDIGAMNTSFAKYPIDPNNIEWVKLKLQHMFDVDQYMRHFVSEIPYQHHYTQDEMREFTLKAGPRITPVDSENTRDLKILLKIYSWIKISKFGTKADEQAWLIVQHADQDPAFQRRVLAVLETLYTKGETKPRNFAYLFDRVSASWSNPSERRLQRFGTQGTCKAPGVWEPLPNEEPEHLDERRKSVGLESEAEYIARFKTICH